MALIIAFWDISLLYHWVWCFTVGPVHAPLCSLCLRVRSCCPTDPTLWWGEQREMVWEQDGLGYLCISGLCWDRNPGKWVREDIPVLLFNLPSWHKISLSAG